VRTRTRTRTRKKEEEERKKERTEAVITNVEIKLDSVIFLLSKIIN
jgi:hypothetical protein